MKQGDVQMYRKFIEFAKLMNIYLNHFPKHEKYALADRIRNTAYQVYDLITEGQKKYHKKTTLTTLDIAHEQLRMQLYLAYELGYFRFKDGSKTDDAEALEAHRWQAISKMVDELGRMIGGWIRNEAENLK
jgi:four helix bundle protein